MKWEKLSHKVIDFIRTKDENPKYKINQKKLRNYD